MKPGPENNLLIETTSFTDAPLSILLVEDNPGDVVLVRELLKSSGIDFSLRNVSTLKETLLLCVEHEYDVILLDLGLTDSTGLETLKKILVFNVKSPVVVMTGLDDEDLALESLRLGAQDYLVKSRLTTHNIIRGIRHGIERKKIQDFLTRSTRQFSLLSSTTLSLNECEDISTVFEISCRNISMLLENSCVYGLELNGAFRVHTSGQENTEAYAIYIKDITGINPVKPTAGARNYKQQILDIFNEGTLHKISDSIPPPSPKGLEYNLQSDKAGKLPLHIYGIGFIKADIVYGGLLIFSRTKIGKEEISIIETISNQASLTIHRRVIENNLKISESKYRKLNRDLEKKVRERTRDLETSNYQLNQELIERHIAEEALRKSEMRLKELNATKDKFFNIIAHDLKNPFTSLIGSTDILMESLAVMKEEQIRQLVQIVNDSAKSGYSILQNLLDWTRSQTGLIVCKPEKIDLKKIIDDNISDFRVIADRKGITLVSEVKKDMSVNADKNMMNAILRNLIGNAIKFTQKSGTVAVASAIAKGKVIISVRDTGIGIPKEKIDELFRLDSYYTRPGTQMEPGTGLGLKLSREFIEMQGGEIRVESTVNKGSKFIFSIPLKQI